MGPDHTLDAAVDTASPVLGGWTALSFPLVAGTWRLDPYQSPQLATAEQIQDVLADVQGVYINAEFHTGTDVTNINSVALGHPPTPCRPDLTGAGVPGQAGYGVPDGALTNDDFFYYSSSSRRGIWAWRTGPPRADRARRGTAHRPAS